MASKEIDIARQRDVINDLEADMPTPDPDYAPTETEKILLAIMADEGMATVKILRMRGGFDGQYVYEMCRRLAHVGWLWKLKRPDVGEYGNVKAVDGHYVYNAGELFDPGTLTGESEE
jgi:hypothetical protein